MGRFVCIRFAIQIATWETSFSSTRVSHFLLCDCALCQKISTTLEVSLGRYFDIMLDSFEPQILAEGPTRNLEHSKQQIALMLHNGVAGNLVSRGISPALA